MSVLSLTRYTAYLLCILMLSGCGFKLRTASHFPAELQNLIVTSEDPESALYLQLVKQMNFANLAQSSEGEATAQLHIVKDGLSRRSLSLFKNGQVAEHELIYSVTYELTREFDKPVSRRFEVTRNYQDDPNSALAKSKELELILSEMRLQASRQIIRELSQL